MRERLANDPHRPQVHFLPPANWMNDPNGLIQWRGRYHLFYQHNPVAPTFGPMHWGHAVSEDLVHWTDLPIALSPTPGSVDADGCWSGCAVDDDGTPRVLYTGYLAGEQRPCLASSADHDNLTTWEKHPENPVIAGPPASLNVTGFRDHAVWREDGIWYQIIGSGIQGVGGTALLYRSPDLVHWEYAHPITVGDSKELGEMWECPDLFPLGDKHLLLISPVPLRRSLYLVGSFENHRFFPDSKGVLDFGGHFYAPQTMRDEAGRRLMWGWLWEGRSQRAQEAAGWAGVMSLPRVLSLGVDGELLARPVEELTALRQTHHQIRDVSVDSGSMPLEEVQGDLLELRAVFELGDAEALGLGVRCSPDDAEGTFVLFHRSHQRLELDRQQSSLDPETQRDRRRGPLALAQGETLTLHVFVDRSVVEVFANGRVCVATRIYPSREDSQGVRLIARGGRATLKSLDVWHLASIWTARQV